MSRLKLLILDACVVIQLHELGRWQQVVDQCDIHLSEIVAQREVRFDDANGTRIDLEPAILSKAITLFSVEALKVEAFRSRFDDSYLGVLDAMRREQELRIKIQSRGSLTGNRLKELANACFKHV